MSSAVSPGKIKPIKRAASANAKKIRSKKRGICKLCEMSESAM
jgi:hypothetical protein